MELTFIILLYWACNNFFFLKFFSCIYLLHVCTYLLACLLASLLACLLACLIACLLACLLTYLQKKKYLKNSSVKLIFLFKYCRDIYYSSIIEGPLPETKKMSYKIRNFNLFYFPDNYFIFNWFLLHVRLQTKSWLIAIDILLWFHMMQAWQPSIM